MAWSSRARYARLRAAKNAIDDLDIEAAMTLDEARKQVEYATAKMLRAAAWEHDLRLMHEKAKEQLDAAEAEVRVSRKQLSELKD